MDDDNDESFALVQLSGGLIVDEPAEVTSPPPSNNASATSSASASASANESGTIPNNDNAHLSDQMEVLGIDQNIIVQGNQPSLPELRAFCQSESLTEQGLRDRLSHLEYQCGDPTYYILLGYICANDFVTVGMVQYFQQRFPSLAGNAAVLGVTPLHCVCLNKNATADIVRCVIESNPEALRTQDEAGQTPLVYLCLNKRLDENMAEEILMLILDTCPESAKWCMHDGFLPILIKCEYRSPKFCCLLIKAYPDSIQNLVLEHDENGLQPMEICQS
eukprot:scaffold2742_cov140-Skeletonema_marinoi.AAC.4